MSFHPMLAGKCEDTSTLKYPVLCSPKLDGVRALVIGGKLMSRSLKPIPNRYAQTLFARLPEGTDGELILGKPTDKDVYRNTVSAVMSEDGEPEQLHYFVFDNFTVPDIFDVRFDYIRDLDDNAGVKIVPHKYMSNSVQVADFEEEVLAQGYEGVMIRSLDGPYKQGRSTVKEGYLLKLKRFLDSEAMILGMVELQHNENEPTVNALGRTERSTAKAGQVGAGTMGALQVRDLKSDVEFEIGTGFTAEDRKDYWLRKPAVIGMIAKYKYFPMGSKDKPRFPVFLGFRNVEDL